MKSTLKSILHLDQLNDILSDMESVEFPMRINKYLAWKKYATRRGADELIKNKNVLINGRIAILGDQVGEKDQVEVRSSKNPKEYKYLAYNKPSGIATEDIGTNGLFPLGRLDKNSYGLIILTNDGRLTDRLLNPENNHEKEYLVRTIEELPSNFKKKMEAGVDIEGYVTKKCTVDVLGDKTFRIVLTEGKKHQIRRMCAALGIRIRDLKRTRIMNLKLGTLEPGKSRAIKGRELDVFLESTGL